MGDPNLMKVIWRNLGYSLASDHSPVNGMSSPYVTGKRNTFRKNLDDIVRAKVS